MNVTLQVEISTEALAELERAAAAAEGITAAALAVRRLTGTAPVINPNWREELAAAYRAGPVAHARLPDGMPPLLITRGTGVPGCFEKMFGTMTGTGTADNESIDADLAREYESTHDDD